MERTDFKQDCLIVLGMHRSGTSAMARVVNLLGAEIGDNLLPAVPNNPKGFWEHEEILELHRRLLSEIRSFWDDIRPLPKEWYREPAVEKIRSEIVEIIQRDFGHSELWVLKEPRMCRLLKLWHPIFCELNCRAHFIFIFRHPLEVAASLREMRNLPLNKSLQLWLEYVLEAEQETRNYPRVFVSFQGTSQRVPADPLRPNRPPRDARDHGAAGGGAGVLGTGQVGGRLVPGAALERHGHLGFLLGGRLFLCAGAERGARS